MIAIEISLITPPVGLDDFVLKAVVPDVPTGTGIRGVLPFVVMDIVRILLLIAVPALALLIPSSVERVPSYERVDAPRARARRCRCTETVGR